MVYHSTEVVRATATIVTLDSGGYRTHTTKTRMNQAANQYGLGYQVFQKDFEWFVGYHGAVHPFQDGMTFTIAPIEAKGRD